MTAALALLALALAADPCVAYKDGSAFRTCFNPGERLEISAAPSFGNEATSGTLSGVLRLRKNRRGHHDPGLMWIRDHTLFEANLTLPRMRFDDARVEGTLYQGVFVRRYEEGAIVIPGSTAIHIPFPFDIGLAAEAGRIAYDRTDPDHTRLGVTRAAIMFDASRRIPWAYRFAFGPEVEYALELTRGAPARHLITPFSGGVVDVRLESDDGLWIASIKGRAGYQLEVQGPSRFVWSASAEIERVLFAIDDRPLAPFVRFEASEGGTPRRLAGIVGLRLAANL